MSQIKIDFNKKSRVEEKKTKKKIGFAAMNPERHRQICSEGGRASHRQGVGHEWTAEEARAAGRKGGLAAAKKKKGKNG
jgi:uncharacterized protein